MSAPAGQSDPSPNSNSVTVTSLLTTSGTILTQSGSISVDTQTTVARQNITSNYSSTNVTEDYWSTTAPPHKGAGGTETAFAVIIILVVLSVFLGVTCYFLRKKGKLTKLPCYKPISRTRRSSTSSSRRALEEHEVMDNTIRPKPDGQADDMFTIDEFDNSADPQEAREEYYYDEVFGQSQFEDETTNNAMRELYNDHQTEDEILDLDFETLGIKIEDYGLDHDRKNTV